MDIRLGRWSWNLVLCYRICQVLVERSLIKPANKIVVCEQNDVFLCEQGYQELAKYQVSSGTSASRPSTWQPSLRSAMCWSPSYVRLEVTTVTSAPTSMCAPASLGHRSLVHEHAPRKPVTKSRVAQSLQRRQDLLSHLMNGLKPAFMPAIGIFLDLVCCSCPASRSYIWRRKARAGQSPPKHMGAGLKEIDIHARPSTTNICRWRCEGHCVRGQPCRELVYNSCDICCILTAWQRSLV